MKKDLARWVIAALMLVFLVVPIAAAAAQNSGPTLYLPVVSKAPPQPAVKQVGPSGGTFTSVAIDPVNYVNPSILYVGTFGQGVQKSLDGGLTWQPANTGLGNMKIQSLAIGSNGSTLFAGTYQSGVYRSTDGGANWQAVNNFGDATLSGLIVYDIEIAPTQPQIVFLSGRVPGGCYTADCELKGYIYKSTNGGESWTKVWDSQAMFPNTPIGDYSYDIEVDPTNAQIVYFTAHRNGVYKSENGGSSWEPKQNAIQHDLTARKLLLVPVTNNPLTVFNSTYQTAGVYKSSDAGESWITKNNGLPPSIYGFALSRDSQNQNDIYLGTGDVGVYKSTNLAENWNAWGLDSNFIWVFGQVPGTSPALYAATGGNGLQYSPDGSANWQPRSQGIFNTNITGLVNFNGALYAGVNGGGVYRSADQGVTWQAVNGGLGNLNVQNLIMITSQIYAVTTTSLYVSNDGYTWSVAYSFYLAPSSTLKEELFAVSSARSVFPEEEQRLLGPALLENSSLSMPFPAASLRPITAVAHNWQGYWTGTAGGGLYLNGGFCTYNGRTVYALHENKVNNFLYASITLQSGASTVIRKVKDTDNDPCNWSGDSTGIPAATLVNGFSSTTSRLFATSSTGVYYYDSANQKWIQGNNISDPAYSIAADPNNPNLLYAAAETGAYYSGDGGLNWKIVPRPELQNKAFLSVQVDAGNPNIVYFGSREGSTYRWDKTLP